MKGFLPLAKKELLEMLRDPKIVVGAIVVPLLLFPLLGAAISSGMETATAGETITVGVLNKDLGKYGASLVNFLLRNGVNVTAVQGDPLRFAEEKRGVTAVIVIPENFTEDIENHSRSYVEVVGAVRSLSMSDMTKFMRVRTVLDDFSRQLELSMIGDLGAQNPENITEPLEVRGITIAGGEVIYLPPDVVASQIAGQSMVMPMFVIILISMVSGFAAISVAQEKESKTLEVLLTLPVKRSWILLSKILVVIIVGFIATASYLVGFSMYMSTLTESMPAETYGVSLQMPMWDYALVGVSMFLSILSALMLSVLVASYTQDVRSAQSLTSVIYIPVMLPAIILMFASPQDLPLGLQALIYAMPFTYPILAARAFIEGTYLTVYLGIMYQAVFSVAVLLLAARLYATERIVTARLVWRRR